jgi:hypothetical protein
MQSPMSFANRGCKTDCALIAAIHIAHGSCGAYCGLQPSSIQRLKIRRMPIRPATRPERSQCRCRNIHHPARDSPCRPFFVGVWSKPSVIEACTVRFWYAPPSEKQCPVALVFSLDRVQTHTPLGLPLTARLGLTISDRRPLPFLQGEAQSLLELQADTCHQLYALFHLRRWGASRSTETPNENERTSETQDSIVVRRNLYVAACRP